MRGTSVLPVLCFAAACASDTIPQQQARGETAYVAFCQPCHEQDEGIGPRLTPAVLATRMTAAQLFTYNRDKMPYNAGRTLTDPQYWDITAYLLERSDLAQGDRPLSAQSAEYPLHLPPQ